MKFYLKSLLRAIELNVFVFVACNWFYSKFLNDFHFRVGILLVSTHRLDHVPHLRIQVPT